jgi:hypothetical protein
MHLCVCAIILLLCWQPALCQTKPQSPRDSARRAPASETVKKGPAFDPFVPRQAAEKLLALDNVQIKSNGLSRLASVIWKYDEDYSRTLFEKALTVSHPQNDKGDGRLKIIYRNVISVIATKDPRWAKRLIDGSATFDEKGQNSANLNTALSLIDGSPGQAVEFAQRALRDQVHPGFLNFLLTLRRADPARADQMFLQVLAFLGQQPQPDIKGLHSIGVFLFTAPGVIDSDSFQVTVVDDMLVPNITVQRPNASPALVRAYLSTAGNLLLRAATDAEQKKYTYALGRLLLPKAQAATPDLVPQIEAAMAAVSSNVAPSLVNDTAFKYIDMKPRTPEESLANAERKTDDIEREMAFLDIVVSAWWKSDFKTARKAASMIRDIDASQALNQLIDFGEAATLLKSDPSSVRAVERVAYKLSPGFERALLLLAIAQTRVKSGDIAQAEEAIDAALKAASGTDELRRPALSLIAAGQLAQLRSSRTPTVTASTIKDLNSFEKANYGDLGWDKEVQIGALKSSFPLKFSGLDLNLDTALRAILLSDLEIGFARAQEIKNEWLRSRALVEFVAAYIEKVEKDSQTKQLVTKP